MNNICKRKINKTTAILLALSMIFVRGTEVRASDSGADIQPEKTIAAQWKANAVKITFNSNDGGVAPNEQVYTYGADRSLPGVCSMSKTGYSFIGWSESPSATVPDWKAGDTSDTAFGYADSTKAVTKTLYAVWEPDNLTTISDFLGYGKQSVTPAASAYNTASLVEKVNYLEKQLNSLKSDIDTVNSNISLHNNSGGLLAINKEGIIPALPVKKYQQSTTSADNNGVRISLNEDICHDEITISNNGNPFCLLLPNLDNVRFGYDASWWVNPDVYAKYRAVSTPTMKLYTTITIDDLVSITLESSQLPSYSSGSDNWTSTSNSYDRPVFSAEAYKGISIPYINSDTWSINAHNNIKISRYIHIQGTLTVNGYGYQGASYTSYTGGVNFTTKSDPIPYKIMQ